MTPLVPRAVLGIALAGLLLLPACTGPGPTTPRASDPGAPLPATLRLVAFSSCADALAEWREVARDNVGPYGFYIPFGPGDLGPTRRVGATAGETADGRVPVAAPGGADAQSYSGTNTHEVGVDEPDLVKTDGRRIVTVTGGVLRVVDPAARRITGQLNVADGDADPVRWSKMDLLLSGDRALVLINHYYEGRMPVDMLRPSEVPPAGGTRLLLVDLTGPPRVLSRLDFDGQFVDARQVGDTARLVVRSVPRLNFPYRDKQSGTARIAANRRVVDTASAEDLLPRYALTEAGRTTTGHVPCERLSRPAGYSGASMLTVLTFDLAGSGLGTGDPLTVVADGDTVYGTGGSLYVASDERWRAWRGPVDQPADTVGRLPEQSTRLFKFDTSGAGRPRFVAAGTVPGWLISQYAMSEWDGRLRVASTVDGSDQARSVSTVYVLRQQGDQLSVEGSVSGLGRGERIYSVRFAGPVGYVVTFRQTDPLYTVDLSDPGQPRVLGELKITGYSAYLHPIEGDRLIGVGQEANARGQAQGTQVSVFDVSDLERPRRVAQRHVKGGYSEAEIDPHAFLYWPADRLLVLPLGGDARDGRPRNGALVLRVDDAGLTEIGTASRANVSMPVRRSLVVGGLLWMMFDDGLRAVDKSTLEQRAWIAL